MKPTNPIYLGDYLLDPPESGFECPGCGLYFNGYGTLSHHTTRCQKALLLGPDDDFEDGLTDPERAQLEFDNAELNEYPE